MPFYNTIEEKGLELKKSEEKTKSQGERITEWFQNNPGGHTPFEVWHRCFDCSVPITSVRRALTDLTNDKVLKKSEVMKMADYGKDNHLWYLAPMKPVQLKLFEED